MDIALVGGVFLILMVAGIPIGTALGVSGVLALFIFDLGYQMIGVNFAASIASFPLLAIPFFVLAGVILEKAGLAARIARFFELLAGRTTGGLAMVAVLTCIFWGALSGSGPATTAAVGLILLRPMIRQGYTPAFAAATIANAADLSIIIPPSIAFIIYGNITGVSVSALFMAGIVPGLLMGLSSMWVARHQSRHMTIAIPPRRPSAGELLHAARDSFWALLAPVIILGGIYSGIVTPTEAAVVAVFYSLFTALVVYRSVSCRDLFRILVDAAVTSSVIMFLVAFAGIFSWAISTLGVTDRIAGWIIDAAPNTLSMILMINLLLLILGMFLDAISISYLVMPLLIPVLAEFDVDPLWYGVLFVSALAISQTTPPVGVNLFTAANLIESDVDAVARRVAPFVAVNIAVLVVLTLFPGLSTFLPTAAGLIQP